MKVLIIGGAGMIGRKLAERLAKDGALGGKEISSLTLYDVVEGAVPVGAKMQVKLLTGDLPADGEARRMIADRPDVIFHLAAIVSGEAEQDFDKG
jgi:nucleoside-diphosphate-sugar epimerase